MTLRIAILAALILSAACGDDSNEPAANSDAGKPDAGKADAGSWCQTGGPGVANGNPEGCPCGPRSSSVACDAPSALVCRYNGDCTRRIIGVIFTMQCIEGHWQQDWPDRCDEDAGL